MRSTAPGALEAMRVSLAERILDALRRHRLKVATKFALTYFVTALAALSSYGVLVAHREATRLEEAARVDLLAMGEVLAPAMIVVWAREGPGRVEELVSLAARARPEVGVRWATSERVATTIDGKHPRGRLVEHTIPILEPVDPAHRMPQRSSLTLSRVIPAERELLLEAIRDELIVAGALVIVSSMVARLLGEWLIGGPLGRVAEQVRRVGTGDLSQRLAVRGSREVAELKASVNSMVEAIEEARERARREQEARVAAVEQLRHTDRLRTVGTLASGIAHELGTPLNVILIRAKMIARSTASSTDVVENAEIIASQTHRVTRIVRQLLDFARRRPPSRGAVNLAGVVERTVGMLEPLSRKAGVRVERECVDLTARVDADQIEQSLMNLLVNAVQASSPGSTIRVKLGAMQEEGRPFAQIDVRDEGAGMSQEVQSRILEPFFTTKPVGVGTGLGLSVVHGIVLDHGGRMRIASEEGKGSTFTLLFPLDDESVRRPPPDEALS